MPGARFEIHNEQGDLIAEGSVSTGHKFTVHQLTDDPVTTIIWNSQAEFERAHGGSTDTITYLDELPPAPVLPQPEEEPAEPPAEEVPTDAPQDAPPLP